MHLCPRSPKEREVPKRRKPFVEGPSLFLALVSCEAADSQGIHFYITADRPPMSTDRTKILANWNAIRALAPQRFDVFARPGDVDELDAISRYVWNIEACSVLHVKLHAVEVTFRNKVHNALTALHGSRWYDSPGFLVGIDLGSVADAKNTLTRNGRPHDPDRVVAALSFGFWTRIYSPQYNRKVVSPTLSAVFPYYSGLIPLAPAVVAPLLRDTRHLRNRVSHYEPIVFNVRLPRAHREICDLIRWMHPHMAEMSDIGDDFPSVYGKTWQAYRPIAEELFGR